MPALILGEVIMKLNQIALLAPVLAASLLLAAPAGAQSTEQDPGAQPTAEQNETWNKIVALPWVIGPQKVTALQGATLDVKQKYVFLDVAAVKQFMQLTENPRDGTEQEQIFGPDDLHWFGIIEFSEDGYVEDKEEIDAAAILDSIKEGTESANEARRQNGWSEMHVTGWHRPPSYDPQTNRLEWAIDASNSDGSSSTNFNTRVLGRRGVTSVVLVTNPQNFDRDLAEFKVALAGYEFDPGNRYSEFQSGDKVAAYGLGALIAGGAAAVAAKTGIWKAFGKFILIGGAAAFAAVWGTIKKLFGRRKAT